MSLVALLLLVPGGLLSGFNWLCLVGSLRGRRHVSPVLPGASLLTAAGLALHEPTRPFWWLALFTDPTLFTLLASAPRLAAGAWRTSAWTRQRRLVAEDGARRFELSLHRGGHFLLRAAFSPGLPCDEHGALIDGFGAVGRWEETPGGRLRLWSYREGRELTLEPGGSDYTASETRYPPAVPYPYDRLDGLRFRPAA